MSIDLALNAKGDIVFEDINEDDVIPFIFNFHYATSDSLLFNFFSDTNDKLTRQPKMLQFNFNTYTVLNNKKIKYINDYEYIKQCIRIALNTELGTVKENEDLGSTLYKHHHMAMDFSLVEKRIISCVEEAIKHIITEPEIKVYFQKTNYYDFYNGIKIVISYKNEKLWFVL